jgi:alanine dehydrogenase
MLGEGVGFLPMVRVLRDEDLTGLVDPVEAVARMEEGYRADARGEVVLFPRARFEAPEVSLAWLGAAVPSEGVLGFRTYLHGATGEDRGQQSVLLYGYPTMEARAIFVGRRLGNLRTGAALAAALRLAQPDAREVGLIGTGGQARNALACIVPTLRPRRVVVWGRNRTHREEFRAWSERALGNPVELADRAEDVIEAMRTVVLATSADEVLVSFEAVHEPHLLLSISAYRRPELDPRILDAAPRVWTDSVVQASGPGTLFDTPDRRSKLRPLATGLADGSLRDSDTTRIVINTGAAWEEVLLGQWLFERAESAGRGTDLPLPDRPLGSAVF